MGLRLYKLLNLIASPVLFSLIFIRLFKGKESKPRFKERFGIPSFKRRPKGKLIWFHATSVGEMVAVLPVLDAVTSDRRFDGTILLTSTTLGSLRLLEKRNLPGKVIHQLYPIDNYFTVKRFIDFWKPDLTVFIESEFWPCALSKAASVGKVISLNTSISDRSFKNWMIMKSFAGQVFAKIDRFFPKSVTDLKRLEEFGFHNAQHIGNLKYSSPVLPFNKKELDGLRKSVAGRKIVLFASTHPGEEELAIEAFNALKRKYPSLLFILVPRHPVRTESIGALLKEAGLSYVLRSDSNNKIPNEASFYIVDTIGETGLFFALSPITVMGGSFAKIGGHNLIEPAKLKSVVISGPHTHKFKDIIEEFKESKAACFAENNKECIALIKDLLSNENLLNMYRKNAASLLASKKDIMKQVTDSLIAHIN
jgi:3-deoxy-D-manno-octulosonic-acid transferase